MNLTTEFKQKVRLSIINDRQNFTGSDAAYSRRLGINGAVYSRLKSGEIDRILSDQKWVELGRRLNVSIRADKWSVVRTKVYEEIEDSIRFCQIAANSMILVDENSIGKTFCSKHVCRNLQNAFYIDCSQSKTKSEFIRALAKEVGADHTGSVTEIKSSLKYMLSNVIETPVVVLDDFGDLNYSALLEVKELWNATEGSCGWYAIGAEGLKYKITKGINRHQVGFAELFARFSSEFVRITPIETNDKNIFYRDLITQVATVNAADALQVNDLVKNCLTKGMKLRYLKTLIKLGE